ncbi:MAG: helicase-related protein, partial [Oscillospiraceae bacterium]
TQRAEDELNSLFPAARILRMDADTTMSRFAHQRGFDAFARGDYDIMIGTQMVAKGLDFPNVTLVGVLSADQALYADDFRGFERTFSLITQVVGRGGRSALPGRAIIQTFSPDNHVLALAAAQDYKSFFSEEIAYRRVGLYPPFCDIACVMFSCEDEQAAADDARWFLAALTQAAARDCPALPMRVLGPAECRPYRVAGRYRCRLLLKCRNSRPTRALLGAVSADYHAGRHRSIMAIDLYYDSNV